MPLQVEHPVTEWISNVNIPACQLMIGMGIRLDRMADIRRLFSKEPDGSDPIGTPIAAPLFRLFTQQAELHQKKLGFGSGAPCNAHQWHSACCVLPQ